jgi:DNA-directed RNA polymerase specialized sigma24 family protein
MENGMDESRPRGFQGLTREEFDFFLSKLDPDRELAGEAYLLLWDKLRMYFQSRVCLVAERLADETLNRVARKVARGEEIRNLPAYCYGVARLVLLEYLKSGEAGALPLDELPPTPVRKADELERKERLAIFEKCLRELPEVEARLLVQYWYHDDVSNPDARRQMAEELKISGTALRLRIFRIKAKFEQCYQRCMGETPKKGK